MQKRIIIIIVAALLLFTGCSAYNNEEQTKADSSAIEINGFAFNPSSLTVAKGATVKWTNLDSAPHTVKFEGFESERLGNGGKYEHTFMEPGEYPYICGLHQSMKGKVIVQ